MSSIRPLITITIILAVGVFLFMKINEGPAPLPAEVDAALERAPAAEIPPLSTATNPPPTWSDSPRGASESSPQWAEGATESVSSTLPTAPPTNLPTDDPQAIAPQQSSLASAPVAVPPIPELPPLAPAPETNAVTIPLPANIPVAQYPGDAATANTQMVASPTPPTAEAVSPATPVAPPEAEADRYATTSTETMPTETTATATSVATSSISSAWPEIQGALERQELVAAHEMLSRWYGDPSLTPAEAQQVELLLNQLAGTIVYSTEHRLEPPYTVHAGDTLQTIAQQYDVPWQLLAKINGIPAANMVQPGQQLKVVHGPFSAVVELDKSQLTLTLDGRYAGRFPITAAPDAGASEGQWVLEQKLVQPTTEASGVVSASYAPSAVDHVLVLRNASATAGGATISITGGKSSPSGPTAVAPAAIRLSPSDVEEVADILSVGSPVTIRR